MENKITDTDLIKELKERFESNKKLIKEQEELMSQLKLVNSKLLQSEQLKTNFLSNIRNEINNPLTSIIQLSKNIYFSELDLKQIKKHSELIYQEIQNLDFQLRNIFASAEIEAGESIPNPSSVSISSIIEYIVKCFKHQINKKQINVFITSTNGKEQNFFTDSEKLHLILSNIISNAIIYNIEKGNIRIQYEFDSDGSLNFTISDNGIGISNENKESIFERFNQLDKGSTKFYSGHGLGLAVTKKLLELINGSIEITSEPNKGSTFRIKLRNIESDNKMISPDGNDFMFSDTNENLF